jgi:hypothetical protein
MAPSRRRVFTPGYSQFRPKAADELVTIALALPIDATDGRPKSTWTVST